MKAKFWGVRGSIPTPLNPQQLQSKIASVVQRIEPADLESPKTREAFLAGLPPYLINTVGGNTTCIEIRLSDDTLIIFDAGSGIRELGASLYKKREHIRPYYLFFTHFHWDHIQGLPFFAPQVFDPKCSIKFLSPVAGIQELLESQMRPPFFPVTMEVMNADLEFITLGKPPYTISNGKVYWRKMHHPGSSFSYKITEKDKSIIFSTDTELTEEDFKKTEENTFFYKDADLLIIDSQYTLDEAIDKYGWGHSSYSLAVDFATAWNIKNLVLFHHEPMYNDKKMESILKSAKWYLDHFENNSTCSIYLATENLELII